MVLACCRVENEPSTVVGILGSADSKKKMKREGEQEEDEVCLDESFFINDNYELTTFTFGSQVLQLFCLHSASTDFDLTGQLVWPGAMLMNDYLSKNAELLQGSSVLELGSGVGITGILCSRYCREVVLTDHNEEVLKILKKNIEHHTSTDNPNCVAGLRVEKLEWGDSDQINQILQKYPGGFDLILGADISFNSRAFLYFLTPSNIFSNSGEKDNANLSSLRISSEDSLFYAVILCFVCSMDSMVINESARYGMLINEIVGTRSVVGNLQGVIFEVTLQ